MVLPSMRSFQEISITQSYKVDIAIKKNNQSFRSPSQSYKKRLKRLNQGSYIKANTLADKDFQYPMAS